MDKEKKWLPVVGYEDLYIVSDHGDIVSLTLWRGSHRVLSQYKNKGGYMQVHLSNKGKESTIPVHILVAKAFIPNPHNKPQVNHIKGDKTDNRSSQLEWCTDEENRLHAIKTGLYDVSVSEKRVINKKTGEIYKSATELSKLRGLSRSLLYKKLTGQKNNNTPYQYLNEDINIINKDKENKTHLNDQK